MTARVVALTFHDVVAEGADTSKISDGFYRLQVKEFDTLLAELRRLGYQTVSSRAFRAWQQGKGPLPERAVMLTFDDGYASHVEIVAPLLRRYRFTGTFFVTVDLIGRKGHVTWDQLRQLIFLGMEIGSHALSDAPLTSHAPAALEAEVTRSKHILEERLGVPIHAIAAPRGFWNAAVAQAVQRAGYDAAWLSTIGTNGRETSPIALRRVVVRQPFSARGVMAMVEGWTPAFWWAANQQLLIRILKRVLGVYGYEQLKRRLVPNA